MYGIVNMAIEELIREKFGSEKWEAIKKASAVDIEFFLSNEPYDDSITFRLAGAAAKELDLPLRDVLVAFGEWWVLKTGKEKYGTLMEAGGKHLKEFLINLPVFHSRIVLLFPRLRPPEFKVTDINEDSLHLHYFSVRSGLTDFVYGLLTGLGKVYDVPVKVVLLQSRDDGSDHEIFKVSW